MIETEFYHRVFFRPVPRWRVRRSLRQRWRALVGWAGAEVRSAAGGDSRMSGW